jgi:DMSO reductase family type II enzyme heme b subunit
MRRTLIGTALLTLAIAFAFTLAGARTTRASAPAQAADGQAIYAERCEVCHGAEGDGNGPAAANLDPKPRDFRRGWYKIRTTTSGQLPTDEDLVNIISNGMPGTTMPAWEGVLTGEEIVAVATYIKTFARRFERETPQTVTLAAKVQSSAESIARGREIFAGQAAECAKCHGNAGRGDGPSADELTDDFGSVIVPADLGMAWLFRGGPTPDDVHLRLLTGLTGSPMPSYADVLTPEQIWDLANYVDSLSPDAAPEPQASITAFRVEGPIPADANAPEWQGATEYFYPLVGQIMREPRHYTPSVKGVWVRALYNESEVALLVRWHDRFQDTGAEGQPADTVAVQFPAQLPAGDPAERGAGGERPYFVFGDTAHPVNLWTWNAATNAVEERNGKGAGAVAAQAAQNAQGTASFADGEYTLIVRRALATGDAEDIVFEPGLFIPIAFMAWDGWRGEQDAAGAISSWYLIYLEKPVPLLNYVWIPAAVIAAAFLEGLIVWAVRRGAARRET